MSGTEGRFDHGRHGSPRSRDTERRREGELRDSLRTSCRVDHGILGDEGGIGRDAGSGGEPRKARKPAYAGHGRAQGRGASRFSAREQSLLQ